MWYPVFLTLAVTLAGCWADSRPRNMSLEAYTSLCHDSERENFAHSRFPQMYAETLQDLMETKKIPLSKISTTFEAKGKGTLDLERGTVELTQVTPGGFKKQGSERVVSFEYSFIAPVVKCVFHYRVSLPSQGDVSGKAEVHVVNVTFTLSSTATLVGQECQLPRPTLRMSEVTKILVNLRPDSATSPANHRVAVIVNSFLVGKKYWADQALEVLSRAGVLEAEVWDETVTRARPSASAPDVPPDVQNLLCYVLTSLNGTGTANPLCPAV